VAQLLAKIAGGKPAPDPVDVNPGNITPWTVSYPLSETNRILGISLDRRETADLLTRLTFDVQGDDPLTVTVPTRRPDVRLPADLVEEIARLHGFDSIPATLPQGPGGGLSHEERRLRLLRNIMVGAGFYQLIGFSFIANSDLHMLGLDDDDPARGAINLVNPLNEAEGVLRTTLVPGLLKAASSAISRNNTTAQLFEIGDVFLPGDDELPDQPRRLGFLLAGESEGTWNIDSQGFDLYSGTGVWDLLSDRLGLDDSELHQTSRAPFHPGRAAEILVAGKVIGVVGEIHPSVAESFGLSGRVVVGEIDIHELVVERAPWQYRAPSVFPAVVFDLAFAVPATVAASAVTDAARSAAGELLDTVDVFDVFVGDSVGEDLKSIAVKIRLRAHDRTLTDEEITPVQKAIADRVVTATGGELRGTI
jgi:phenylalanyl-tRNA synthetase beta chain